MGKYMKKKILFSALGGSLFPDLINYLKDTFELYFHDNNNDLKFEQPEIKFVVSPLISSDNYIDFLKNFIEQNKIDIYIPLIDEELIIVKKKLENYNGVKVICPALDFLKLSLNKYDLMIKLKQENISIIKTIKCNKLDLNKLNFPLIVKPIFGRGSRGVQKVEKKEQVKAYFQFEKHKASEVIIQEFFEGDEYSIGVNVNNLNQLLSVSTRKIFEKKGITIKAKTLKNKKINQLVYSIIDKLKPRGPFNIQLILDKKGELKIFEINPRFSTTLLLSYYSKIDEIKMYLDYYNQNFNGKIIEPKDNLFLKRRWENIFYED